MKKFILFLLFTGFVIINISCSNDSEPKTPIWLTEFREITLTEINYARTNPPGYADERLLSYKNENTDNGSYNDLKNIRSAVTVLTLNSKLNSASQKYSEYLADNNVFGHYEDGTPTERCTAEDYGSCGENLAANSRESYNAEENPESTAIGFIIQLIIDEGIADVGHRENILNSNYKSLGAGFGQNDSSTYKNYFVNNFGLN